jgi:hypothetical protein
VAAGERSCGLCGAAIGSGGGPALWPYLVGAGVLAILLVAAVALHSYLRPAVVRPPSAFLPESTLAVVNLDLRPGSPARLEVEKTWSREDRELLAQRGVQLMQRLVDWSGLQLDLREDASAWFGGEALVASIGGGRFRAPGPRSLVLIVRTTDLREARRDLDRAVEELAREGEWRRSTVRVQHQPITVWSRANGSSAMAYAVADGCVVLSANEELVRACLESASGSGGRLKETEGFQEAARSLPKTALIWGYASAPDMIGSVRRLLPALQNGWWGVARAFLRQSDPEPTAEVEARPGSVAFAVSPEKEGIRLHGVYWRGPAAEKQAEPAAADELFRLVPREAAGFMLVRGFNDLAPALLDGDSAKPAAQFPLPFWNPMHMLLQRESLPESVLIMALPRKPEEERFATAAALMGGGAGTTAARLRTMLPHASVGKVGKIEVIAADEEGLRQIEKAASDEKARLDVSTEPDVIIQTWARPAEFWPAMERIGDLGFRVRSEATGDQGSTRRRRMLPKTQPTMNPRKTTLPPRS